MCINYNPKSAFTFIELMVAIVILGLLAAIIVPQFRAASYVRDEFIEKFNTLTNLGWQQAIAEGKLHRVLFDMQKKQIVVEQVTSEKAADGSPVFEPMRGAYLPARLKIPEQIQIKQVIVEGFDELKRFGSAASAKVWFFIVPEGLTQEVTVNLIDTKDRYHEKPRQVGLVLNPYSAQFKVYNAFQK